MNTTRLLGIVVTFVTGILVPAVAAGGDARNESAFQLIDRFDRSKTREQENSAEVRLASLSPDDKKLLRSYVWDKTRNGQKRFSALKALGLPREEHIREVGDLFRQDRDRDLRVALTMEMGRLKHAGLTKALQEVLERTTEDPFVQVSAAWSLALGHDYSGKQRALQSVIKAEPWRDFGMQALVVMKAVDVLPQLTACARSAQYLQRNSCRLAKLRIELDAQARGSMELLSAAMLEKDYFEVWGWCARHLVEIGTPESGEVLARTASNKIAPSRNIAMRALLEGIQQRKWTKTAVDSWLRQ